MAPLSQWVALSATESLKTVEQTFKTLNVNLSQGLNEHLPKSLFNRTTYLLAGALLTIPVLFVLKKASVSLFKAPPPPPKSNTEERCSEERDLSRTSLESSEGGTQPINTPGNLGSTPQTNEAGSPPPSGSSTSSTESRQTNRDTQHTDEENALSSSRSSINPINSPGVQREEESGSSTTSSISRTPPEGSSSSPRASLPSSQASSSNDTATSKTEEPPKGFLRRMSESIFRSKKTDGTKVKRSENKSIPAEKTPISIEKATLVIETCIELLQKGWIDHEEEHGKIEGLFRVPGSLELLNNLFKYVKKSKKLTKEKLIAEIEGTKTKKKKKRIMIQASWQEISALLKLTLKNLPSPLLNLDSASEIFKSNSEEEQLLTLNEYLNTIPENERKLIKEVVVFLDKISKIKIIKMDKSNLALTIGQNFFQVESQEYTPQYLLLITTSGAVPIAFMIENAGKLCPGIK